MGDLNFPLLVGWREANETNLKLWMASVTFEESNKFATQVNTVTSVGSRTEEVRRLIINKIV